MYSRVKQLYARGWRDGRTNGDNDRSTFSVCGLSIGRKNTASEFAGRTTRTRRGRPPRVESERGKVRSEPRPPRRAAGGIWRPCNDLTAMVTFLISARFNYTVDEEVLAHPPAPGRSSGASISLSTRFGSPSLLPPDEPTSSRWALDTADPVSRPN